MTQVPKVWCVKLVQSLPGKPRTLQAIARELGLEKAFQPTILPNTPHFNEKIGELGSLVHVQPLVISPSPYPYANHPMMAANGVFYPSADKLSELHQKCGNTAQFIEFPESTPVSVKEEILAKYDEIFSTDSSSS